MPTNTIQSGSGVVLSLFKDDWVTFLCASDISISMNADVLPIRTVGDGHWAKNTYQNLNYSISISGVLKINDIADADWSGLDMIDNQLGFTHIRFRISYYDDDSNIKSVEGWAMVNGISFAASVGALVKNDITLVGNGELKYFDGLIACDSQVLTITVTGQTDADGIAHFNYTYTGAPSQVKYRIDGIGNWIYSLIGVQIDYPGLSVGSHYIDIIPVCMNGYEADNSTSQSFIITQALTCASTITSITTSSTSAYPVFGVTAPNYKYRIDGGAWTTVANSFIVPLGGLSVGTHDIEMVPICSNGVEGTGTTQSFSVTSTPAQSVISWGYTSWTTGNIYSVFVNGVLNLSTSTSGDSGTITVPTGAVVMHVLTVYENSSAMEVRVTDTTLSTVVNSTTGTSPTTLSYSFTANGDDYTIHGYNTP